MMMRWTLLPMILAMVLPLTTAGEGWWSRDRHKRSLLWPRTREEVEKRWNFQCIRALEGFDPSLDFIFLFSDSRVVRSKLIILVETKNF